MTQAARPVKGKLIQSWVITLTAGFVVIIGSITTAYIYIQSHQTLYPSATANQFCSSQIPQLLTDFKSGVFTLWAITISCTSTHDSPAQVSAWFDSQKPSSALLFISTTKSSRYHEEFGSAPAQLIVMHQLTTATLNSQTQIFLTTGFQLQLGFP